MSLEEIKNFCLNKKFTEATFPFDEFTLVFKVKNKMFCLVNVNEANSINLKCEPELAIEWRAKYDAVQPGYHMNKKMWNTVMINSYLTDNEIKEMIDHSYNQVVLGLPKKIQKEFLEDSE